MEFVNYLPIHNIDAFVIPPALKTFTATSPQVNLW